MLPITTTVAEANFTLGSQTNPEAPTALTFKSSARGPWLRLAETPDLLATEMRAQSGRELRVYGADAPSNAPSLVVSRDGTLNLGRSPLTFETLTVDRFTNLVSSYTSGNPYLPPSAAALSAAYFALSNMIQYGGGGGGGSNSNSNSNTLPFVTLSNEIPDVDFGSISCGFIRVVDGGYIDAKSFRNLAQDWRTVAATDVPVSAFALHEAITGMSNAQNVSGSNAIEWRNLDSGALLASLDAEGVFCAYGGFSNLPVSSITSSLSDASSNAAASMAAVRAVRDQTAAMASIAFAKAEDASNAAESVAGVASNAAASVSNLSGMLIVDEDRSNIVLHPSLQFSASAYSNLATAAMVYGPGAACNATMPTSVAAVASVASVAAFASNLSAPLDLLVTAAPTRAVQGNFASNAAAWASNAAVYTAACIAPAALMASNASRWASKAARFASNASSFASNLAPIATSGFMSSQFASNTAVYASNTAFAGCNAAIWSSNTSRSASNVATWTSNVAAWTSNAVIPIQGAALAASNLAFMSAPSTPFASNASSWASNAARYASNATTWLCNWTMPYLSATRPIADRASSTADWASNTCMTLLYIQSLSTTFTGAAVYGSNMATYAYNMAIYASNAIAPSSNAAGIASNWSAAALNLASYASNNLVATQSIATYAQSTALLASNAAFTGTQGALQAQVVAAGAQSNAVAALDLSGRSLSASTWTCNAGAATDSTARFASNLATLVNATAVFSSNTAIFGCNAAVFASNIVTTTVPTARFASNAAVFSSNLSTTNAATQAANYTFTSNTSTWASNQVRGVTAVDIPAIRSALATLSNGLNTATTVAYYASNAGAQATLSSASNASLGTWASNAAQYGSNVAKRALDTAVWASNAYPSAAGDAAWASNWTSITRLDVLSASNAAGFASNTAFRSSLGSFYASNAALWSSNTSVWSSNATAWASNATAWSSNIAGGAPLWSSNTAYFSSNTAVFGSNSGAWASNAARWSSNSTSWASNGTWFASNASSFASNSAVQGSNALTHFASNVVFPTSLEASFASNASYFGSNAAEFASNAAFYASNAGRYGSNAADSAYWASNVAWAASNSAFQPTFVRSYSNAPMVYIVNGRTAGLNGGVGVSLSNDSYSLSTSLSGAYGRVSTSNAVLELRSDGSPVHLISAGISAQQQGPQNSSNAPMEIPPICAPARSNVFTPDASVALYGAVQDSPYVASASSSNSLAWCVFSQSNVQGDNSLGWSSDLGYTTSSGYANVPPSYRGGAGVPTTVVDGTSYAGDWLQLDLPASQEGWVYAPRTYTIVPSLAYGVAASGVQDGQPLRFVLAGSTNNGTTWTTLDATYASTNFGPTNAIITITCPRSTPAVTSNLLLNAVRLVILRVSISPDSAANALFVSAKVSALALKAPPAIGRLSANASQVLVTSRMGLGTINPAQQLHVAGSAVVTHSLGLGGVTRPAYVLELASDSAAKPASSLWSVLSDRRLKRDIEDADLERCYAIVRDVPLRRYAWRDDVYNSNQTPDRARLGWIAQEVAQAFPKAVVPHAAHGLPDCLDLNADQLIAALYGAVQLLQRKVDALASL